MDVRIDQSWKSALEAEWDKPYFIQLTDFVREEYRHNPKTTFPPPAQIFAAFDSCPFDNVKVVILGQDPYHGPGQAHGLAFSVRPGVAIPPSLLNMYKELEATIPGFTRPTHGYLESWARQGVLLLNTVLTVRAGQAHSHASLGWETFTDKVIALINEHCEGVVFLLWGSHAQKKGAIIDRQRHCVLKAPHPSPLSAHRGFFGCNHFVQTDQWLVDRGETPIDWMPVLPAESE